MAQAKAVAIQVAVSIAALLAGLAWYQTLTEPDRVRRATTMRRG